MKEEANRLGDAHGGEGALSRRWTGRREWRPACQQAARCSSCGRWCCLGPTAWAISLSTLFWLTHPVCRGGPRGWLWIAGVVCLAVAALARVISGVSLARAGLSARAFGHHPFMLRMAIGMGAIFSLVILLSMVPIGMLTPCPL